MPTTKFGNVFVREAEAMGRQRRKLTGFGRVLRDFSERKGIFGAPALADALTEMGYKSRKSKDGGVSRTAVDNWMKGRQVVPPDVLPYLETLFELDEEDKEKLTWEFAWGQDAEDFSEALVAA